eukprot:jgi/Antlo1/19/44
MHFEDGECTQSRSQNVHNTWRHILRDRQGIRTEYESRMGTYDQDIHGGSVGNVQDEFCRKLTRRT